ncbi:MAG: type II toxin-antitoxin system YafQ family toxin [Paludibacter sp.]|nr:type II toxin-antitoxin system YafQ family toxin [Paludibacter sp.]
MYQIKTTKTFEADVKRCKKRGYDMQALMIVIKLLEKNGALPAQYKPHKLSGNYKDYWECHIKQNWLLIWKQNDREFILLFTNTGTHSDLFR